MEIGPRTVAPNSRQESRKGPVGFLKAKIYLDLQPSELDVGGALTLEKLIIRIK
jgi:hypothetical protein